MRRRVMASLGGGWKNPYVTDGLVAMWDGKWNAGGGVHDPNATVWKDLIGDSDLIAQIGSYVVGEKFGVFDGSSIPPSSSQRNTRCVA